MLVDRTPQQVRFATHRDEHLVEVPRSTRLASHRFRSMSKALTKLVTPASDRLVCHDHAAFEKQFLDVAQAQLEAKLPSNSTADDTSRETVTVIERFRFLHRAILSHGARNLTMPFKCLARDRTLGEARLFGQPEVDSAAVGRRAWREVKYVHEIPRKFIGSLLACCRSLPNLTEHAWRPTATTRTDCGFRHAHAHVRLGPLIDLVLAFVGCKFVDDSGLRYFDL